MPFLSSQSTLSCWFRLLQSAWTHQHFHLQPPILQQTQSQLLSRNSSIQVPHKIHVPVLQNLTHDVSCWHSFCPLSRFESAQFLAQSISIFNTSSYVWDVIVTYKIDLVLVEEFCCYGEMYTRWWSRGHARQPHRPICIVWSFRFFTILCWWWGLFYDKLIPLCCSISFWSQTPAMTHIFWLGKVSRHCLNTLAWPMWNESKTPSA